MLAKLTSTIPSGQSETEAASTPLDAALARSQRGSRHVLWGGLIGVAIPLILWAILSKNQPEILLPSPRQTWHAFLKLLTSGTLLSELGRTLYRSATGVLLAMAVGIIWGTINGLSTWAASISRPTLSSLMAIPPVIIVALGLIWFGAGNAATRLVIVLVALPLMVITVQESVRNVDADLIEMASVFELSRMETLRHVVAPGIASPVLAATSVTVGQAIRVAVMAELLAAANGVGAEISLARTNLATADLFAWTVSLVIMVIALETFILRPITAYLLRWRGTPGNR